MGHMFWGNIMTITLNKMMFNKTISLYIFLCLTMGCISCVAKHNDNKPTFSNTWCFIKNAHYHEFYFDNKQQFYFDGITYVLTYDSIEIVSFYKEIGELREYTERKKHLRNYLNNKVVDFYIDIDSLIELPNTLDLSSSNIDVNYEIYNRDAYQRWHTYKGVPYLEKITLLDSIPYEGWKFDSNILDTGFFEEIDTIILLPK